LVEGAKIPKGGWVGGDSWFGSTSTAVEVMNKFGVNSTWIKKSALIPHEATLCNVESLA